MARLYAALDSCGLERTSTQRFFHKKFTESILPWIYGKRDFSRFKERILHEAGVHVDKYNQYTLISTPRRWGKTTSVGMFVAATLYAVPDAWISVYSTGRRASKALSDLVHKFLKRLEEGAGLKRSNVLVKNTEELFYAGEVGSDVRRLFSYPASVQVRRLPLPRASTKKNPTPPTRFFFLVHSSLIQPEDHFRLHHFVLLKKKMSNSAEPEVCVICLEGPSKNAADGAYKRCARCRVLACQKCVSRHLVTSPTAGCPHCRYTGGVVYAKIDCRKFEVVTLIGDGKTSIVPISHRARRRFLRSAIGMIQQNPTEDVEARKRALQSLALDVATPFLTNASPHVSIDKIAFGLYESEPSDD